MRELRQSFQVLQPQPKTVGIMPPLLSDVYLELTKANTLGLRKVCRYRRRSEQAKQSRGHRSWKIMS